jgi:thymidylate kinase
VNIIIEGPDGSGKTTVAKEVASRLGAPYIRCPGSTKIGEFLRPLLKNCRDADPIVRALLFAAVDYDAQRDVFDAVFDRSGISGLVYRLAANEPETTELLRQLIRMDRTFLYPVDPCVVVLDASDETLDARMGLRGDETDEGSFFRKNVRALYRGLPSCVHRVNTDNKTVEQTVGEIVRRANQMNTVERGTLLHWMENVRCPLEARSAAATVRSESSPTG